MLRGARTARVGAAALLVTAVLAGATPAAHRPLSGHLELAAGLPVAAGLRPGEVPGTGSPPPGTQPGPVAVFIELDSTAAVDAYRSARQAGRSIGAARGAAITAREGASRAADAVLTTLRNRDAPATELFRTANAVPGVAVTATTAAVRALAETPQVRSVRTLVPKTLTNSHAVQLTRVAQTWQQTGRFGDGLRVAVIDDGIDYTHANYGGPGTPQAYAAIDPSRIEPSYFPTAKVVGGYDFAGDGYDADGASREALVPQPDPNPLACGRHGTHVAGSLAGFGVNADGTTFRGDYSELDAAALDRMRIGPGTAPKAMIHAFKVFGCAGSTVLTAQAMDRALDPNSDGDFSDRVDVVNLSVGADYGAPDDPDNLFVRKLAENGVLPVISAGNGGDLYDVGGSPGNTPEALTVASSRDAYVLRDGAEVVGPAELAGVRGGQYSVAYEDYDSLDLTAPVVPVPGPGNADGCRPLSPSAARAVAGKLAWLQWDDNDATRRCGSAQRTDNAASAGAAGVLLTSSLEHFTAAIAGNDAIPVFQFTGPDTAALRPALEAGTLQVRLTGELATAVPTFDPSIADTPSGFTSRGVRAPAVKPDVAGPGETITSALSASGSGRLVISGTSMSSPHVAGIAALVRQARPDWTVEEVKAAVMNTAAGVHAGEGRQGRLHAPNRVGAGRVDARMALTTEVLAMAAGESGAVSVDFGVVEAAGPVALTETIEVVNKGVTPATYRAAYQPITSAPGVSYELSADRVHVDPGQAARLTVTLRITDPAALRKTPDPTIESVQLGMARQFLADASGRVVLTPSGERGPDAASLWVPVYAAPQPVADIVAPEEVRFRGDDSRAVLNLSGRGVDQGSGAAAYRSLVSVLALHSESPRLPECGALVVADCTPNETAEGGDIRYVGATSTAPLARRQGSPDRALLGFGVTTWGDWYNVGSNTVPYVEIDSSGDGAADFRISARKAPGTDVLLATTVDLHADGTPVVAALPVNGRFGDVDTNVFDTNVIVLPVPLAALGIDPTASSAPVTYTAGVAGYYTAPGDTDGVIDTTGPVSFDAVNPGLWVQGGGDAALSYLARPGTALVVNRDPTAARRLEPPELLQLPGLQRQPPELLVLHQHNASGDRVQAVDVRVPDLLTPDGLDPLSPAVAPTW